MMQTLLPALMFIAFAVILIYSVKRKSKSLEAFRAEAAAQFNVWLAGDSAKQLGLEPGSCEIAKREECIGRDETVVNSYTLTLFLRARTGRYVMFKSTPTGPYVKLVEPAVARIVLKGKYIPNRAPPGVWPMPTISSRSRRAALRKYDGRIRSAQSL